MGDEYQKTLKKLSVKQRQKFLKEDWNSHVMLLQLFEKSMDVETCFESFCLKLCKAVEESHQQESDHEEEEPYSWEDYIKIQLENSPIEDDSSEDETSSKDELPPLKMNEVPEVVSAEASHKKSDIDNELENSASLSDQIHSDISVK